MNAVSQVPPWFPAQSLRVMKLWAEDGDFYSYRKAAGKRHSLHLSCDCCGHSLFLFHGDIKSAFFFFFFNEGLGFGFSPSSLRSSYTT